MRVGSLALLNRLRILFLQQEIPENGADVAHLAQVHGPIMTAGIDLRYMYTKWWSFAKHYWQGVWNQDPDQKHIGILSLMHGIHIFGFSLPVLDLKVEARQVSTNQYMTWS